MQKIVTTGDLTVFLEGDLVPYIPNCLAKRCQQAYDIFPHEGRKHATGLPESFGTTMSI
jgi:hypothetical protein